MAPLPDNNTPVVFIDYTAAGVSHTAEIRMALGKGTSDAVAVYNALKGPMAAFLHTSDKVKGGRFRDVGSNVSFPLTVSAVAGTVSTALDPDNRPNFISYTGRSTDGRRVRFTLFSPYLNLSDNGYRTQSLSGADLTLYNAVTGNTVDARTISGGVPVWNPYRNNGSNAYFQRKIRRTG